MTKTKIVLVQEPFWTEENPSLALAYLTSNIETDTREVKQLNLNLDLFSDKEKHQRLWTYINFKLLDEDDLKFIYPEEYVLRNEPEAKELIELSKEHAKKILVENPDIIGFSLTANARLLSLLCAREIKNINPKIKIVFGGPECQLTESGELILHTGFVDALIIGEGEITFNELILKFEITGNFEQVDGSILKLENGTRIDYKARTLIKKLDEIKFPKFEKEDIQRTKFPYSLPMMLSRGCVAKCAYCTETKYWNYYRFRSFENVILEIKHHVKMHGIKTIKFNDSLINGNFILLNKICDFLINENMDLTWSGNARFEKGLTREFLQKMYDAGCRQLSFGLESANPEVLKLMNKQTDIKLNQQILKDVGQIGIWAHCYVITGFPNEGPEEFLDNIKFLAENNKEINDFSIGALYITKTSNMFLEQEKYGLKLKSKVNLIDKKHELVKQVYEETENENVKDSVRRSHIIDSVFINYLVIKDHDNKFLYKKAFEGIGGSILNRNFYLDNKFYSAKEIIKYEDYDFLSEKNLNKNCKNLVIKIKPLDITKERINQLIEYKPEKILLRIKITKDNLRSDVGIKIIELLNALKENEIRYKISKPLPKCIFGRGYEIYCEKHDIPKNCLDCIEFLREENGKIIFCEQRVHGNTNQTAQFNTCTDCIHKIRKTCNGFCL